MGGAKAILGEFISEQNNNKAVVACLEDGKSECLGKPSLSCNGQAKPCDRPICWDGIQNRKLSKREGLRELLTIIVHQIRRNIHRKSKIHAKTKKTWQTSGVECLVLVLLFSTSFVSI